MFILICDFRTIAPVWSVLYLSFKLHVDLVRWLSFLLFSAVRNLHSFESSLKYVLENVENFA